MLCVDLAAQALLEAIAATGMACDGAYTVRCEAGRVEIEPRAADGFGVSVELRDDAVWVSLGPWTRRSPREPDPDEDRDALALTHDLVAAALWGRVRLRVESLGGQVWRTTICVGAPGRWLTFERQGGGLRAPWRRPQTVTLINRGRPPRPIDERALRPLPWAPWAGIRGDTGPEPEPVVMPVDGELDLHQFSPKEVKPLVLETIDQCLQRGIVELRIVHGKGIGALRRTVHALLDRHPEVVGYRLGGHGAGGWGATLVDLRPRSSGEPPSEPS